jgi:hypothetical protein
MLDVDTFLTALYVIADDFCQSRRPKKRPGPEASLSESEVITLAVFARWSRFASERDFYRPLRRNQPARRFPHAANPPPVQPPGALLYGTDRADRLAPGDPPWGAGVLLPGAR